MQASYTMNITLHRAINTTPYEAVFGITAHRENHQNTDEDIKCQRETTELQAVAKRLRHSVEISPLPPKTLFPEDKRRRNARPPPPPIAMLIPFSFNARSR